MGSDCSPNFIYSILTPFSLISFSRPIPPPPPFLTASLSPPPGQTLFYSPSPSLSILPFFYIFTLELLERTPNIHSVTVAHLWTSGSPDPAELEHCSPGGPLPQFMPHST